MKEKEERVQRLKKNRNLWERNGEMGKGGYKLFFPFVKKTKDYPKF